MENQIQNAEVLVEQPAEIAAVTPKNYFKIGLLTLSGLVILAGVLFLGMQLGQKQIKNESTVATQPFTETTQIIPTQAISDTTQPTSNPTLVATASINKVETGWLKYTHQKFADLPNWEIPWEGFVLYYPNDWKLNEVKDATTASLNLKITKSNGDYLEIVQGAGGGGYCLFPEQPEYSTFEGMGTKYTNFIEINKNNNLVWRLADWPEKDDMWSHQLCESFTSDMFVNGFKNSTSVGFTKIKVTNAEDLTELKEILNKIEILK